MDTLDDMDVRLNAVPTLRATSPADVVGAWPKATPLASLFSGDASSPSPTPWSRWSILAEPEQTVFINSEESHPLSRMDELLQSTACTRVQRLPADESMEHPPFLGGWILALSYGLGGQLEPAAASDPSQVDPSWPWSIVLLRCPNALVFDHHRQHWLSIGDETRTVDRLRRVCESLDTYTLGSIRPELTAHAFQDQVCRCIQYIHAGDIFQVNLSHVLRAEVSGSIRALYQSMLRRAAPWYGAYLELTDPQSRARHFALSCSPELFLDLNAHSRRLVTRPIKGTRPSGTAGEAALRESLKDQAELHMIVDLMRNDLGRVAEFGSVRVDEPRVLERHAERPLSTGQFGRGVVHGVSTISARVRPGLRPSDILRSVFPGGSITGAPKIRAMQIISELERRPRGLYTGAIGFVSDCGNMAFNIAIRTAVVRAAPIVPEVGPWSDIVQNASVSYAAGAGIVADSDPTSEWQETLDKTRILQDLASETPTVCAVSTPPRKATPL